MALALVYMVGDEDDSAFMHFSYMTAVLQGILSLKERLFCYGTTSLLSQVTWRVHIPLRRPWNAHIKSREHSESLNIVSGASSSSVHLFHIRPIC